MPSPPRCFPAPPLLAARSNRRTRSGILHLDRLGGRVERVGHVTLDGRCTVPRRARAAAAADRFVVGPAVRRPSATLLIVPQLAAGMRSGSALARAPKTTSTMRWLVSVFPATTAAGYCACTTDPGPRDHLDVAETSAVERHVLIQQAGEAVVDRRARSTACGTVDAAGDLVVAAGQIDDRAIAVDAHDRADRDRTEPAPSSSSTSSKRILAVGIASIVRAMNDCE